MNTYYPDISSYQPGINLSGWLAVCAKASEGTGWTDGTYIAHKSEAARVGAKFSAYHFLHAGNADAQADHAHALVGNNVPLMLDHEATTGSNPGIGDAAAFIDRYRWDGGICNTIYLPKWYWQQIGSPSLSPLITRHMAVVSSAYTTYSDGGPGWASYGGMAPAVWQYTDAGTVNGMGGVDFNCFKGTADQLWSLWTAGAVNDQPVLHLGDNGSAVATAQTRLNVWGASPQLTVDGNFGALTDTAVRAFQTAHGLTADGVVGPATWAALMAVPPSPDYGITAVPPGWWKTGTTGTFSGTGMDGATWKTMTSDGKTWTAPGLA